VTPPRSVLRVRDRAHFHPDRQDELIIEVVREGEVVATVYGSREGIQVVAGTRMPTAIATRVSPPGNYTLVVCLPREGEACPWCNGTRVIVDGPCPLCEGAQNA
jgi:hypothetical protein